jgi:hypothetical protein
MSKTADRLYNLLPAIYRTRDAEQGDALRGLIGVIAEQVEALEENLAQSYDDHFIETCAEWVIPYIGDLIGYRPLYGKQTKYLSARAEVANTVAYRRRKGTATMLEQLARDVTGWPARVVEYFELLATTQYLNHLRLHNTVTPDLRQWEPLERLNTAFDTIPRTVDVRRISTGEGKYNIPNVGIFLWRLKACPLTGSPAVRVDDNDDGRYMFSPLGMNTPLFTNPVPEDEITHIAEPINVPDPISRRVLDAYMDLYYGVGNSFVIYDNDSVIPMGSVHSCNLSDTGDGEWAHEPEEFIAVDPVLGRIWFPPSQLPQGEVRVDYHYGFGADMGGGAYEREHTFTEDLEIVEEIADGGSIQAALGGATISGAVQIGNSGRYEDEQSLSMALSASQQLELRAANGQRPTIVLNENDNFEITGGENSEVILNGLLIAGARVTIPSTDNLLRKVTFRHCTLVPGLTLSIDGEPLQPDVPNLIVEMENVTVVIDHCIIGAIRSDLGATIEINDSIVDATASTGIAFASLDPDEDNPGGILELQNSTVIGKVFAAAMPLVSNTIFFSELLTDENETWPAPVRVERKQTGCVRFSFVPPGSRVPRRYRCQPDLAVRDAIAAVEKGQGSPVSEAQKENITNGVQARIRPGFSDLRYGRPAYCQLRHSTPMEIRTGADDESEMGVFHQLYQPQRETNLRVRLDEYLRFGLQAGIFYET